MPGLAIIPRYLWIILGMHILCGVYAQEVRYSHPAHDFSFLASANWGETRTNMNGSVYTVEHPNQNMTICLSYIQGNRDAAGYLERKSALEGLVYDRGPCDTVLNRQPAVFMIARCQKERIPYRKMLVGFSSNAGLYLMEITCPEDCIRDHRERVTTILESVRVGDHSVL